MGLGTVAKVVSNGEEVYKNKLDFDEIKKIETCYNPYHIELKRLIDQTRDIFGSCILIDCHSMPSNAAKSATQSLWEEGDGYYSWRLSR